MARWLLVAITERAVKCERYSPQRSLMPWIGVLRAAEIWKVVATNPGDDDVALRRLGVAPGAARQRPFRDWRRGAS
eukprot:3471064-Alexandrium_andersonii.AAC.1